MLSGSVCTQFHRLDDVRVRADDVRHALLKQPVGKVFLFAVGQRLIFFSPVHTRNDGIRPAGLGAADVLQDDVFVDVVYDIGRSHFDAVRTVGIVEQGDAETILMNEQRIALLPFRRIPVGAGIRNVQ